MARGGVVALATLFVALATLLQMYIDWEQSGARGLEQLSLRLKIAVVGAALLSLLAALLALTAGERRGR